MRYSCIFAFFFGCFFQSASAQDFEPLLITLDHNNDFVLTGIGQRIGGIEFDGPVGAFEPAQGSTTQDPDTGEYVYTAPAPFEILLSGQSSKVTYGILGPAEVSGSFPLLFGPTDLDLVDDIEIRVGWGVTPTLNPFSFICDSCAYPSAIYTADGGIEVTNINDPIIRVTVFSNDGALVSVTDVPADATIVSETPTEVTLEKLTGFQPADFQGLTILSGVSSTQNVFVKFGLEDGRDFGPMVMARAVPEPSGGATILLAIASVTLLRRRRGS